MKPFKPMMAVAASILPAGPDWTFEVKWDGYRTIAFKDKDCVTLISRNLKNVTSQYPAVAGAISSLKANQAILDGEIVALDEHGRPSFQALQHRATSKLHIAFYAFDLLVLDGRELKHIPLEERRRQLAKTVKGSSVLLSEPLPGTPKQIEKALSRLGLEGVVAKRRDSRYEPGKRSDAWIKVRFAKRQELVVGGFTPGDANFDSILVGYYEGKKLYFAGKVRAGFTPHLRTDVFARMRPMKKCPFVNLPNSVGRSHWGEGITVEDMEGLNWVKPDVVVEVAFTEWTRDSNLRHAAFVALREDKSARDVKRET